jgi:hypothetical protein
VVCSVHNRAWQVTGRGVTCSGCWMVPSSGLQLTSEVQTAVQSLQQLLLPSQCLPMGSDGAAANQHRMRGGGGGTSNSSRTNVQWKQP